MAQSQKSMQPPLVIPNPLAILTVAFSIDSEESAKVLIEQATATIYCEKRTSFDLTPTPVSKHEVDGIYALMKALKPTDFLETLYAAQVVTGHILGMRKLTQSSQEDQRLGLKLLRLSNEAMERLEKKRNGGHQNINVTNHIHAPSNQPLISK